MMKTALKFGANAVLHIMKTALKIGANVAYI